MDIVKFFVNKIKAGEPYLYPEEKRELDHENIKVFYKMVQTYKNYSFWTKNINGKKFTQKEYIDFMGSRENSHNCDECPENKGFDSWEGKLPCGQQNCWVTCHVRMLEKE